LTATGGGAAAGAVFALCFEGEVRGGDAFVCCAGAGKLGGAAGGLRKILAARKATNRTPTPRLIIIHSVRNGKIVGKLEP